MKGTLQLSFSVTEKNVWQDMGRLTDKLADLRHERVATAGACLPTPSTV